MDIGIPALTRLGGEMEESLSYRKAHAAALSMAELTNALDTDGHPWRRRLVMWLGNILIRRVMLPLSPYLKRGEAERS